MLLHLASSLATVVRLAGWLANKKLSFSDFQILNVAACKCFLVFNAVFDVRWTNIIL